MTTLALISGVSVHTKTYATMGLVILAVFEFVTAMYLYGTKGAKQHGKLMLNLHRIGGYIFLLWWLWPMAVGADLLTRLSRYEDGWHFDGPRFYHAALGIAVFMLLLMKIAFVRFYTQYRHAARWMGIILAFSAIITWLISGWFWLCMMGGVHVAG